MALINCPECNKQVSDNANNCPHCGFEVRKHLEEMRLKKEREELELKEKIKREKEEAKKNKLEAEKIKLERKLTKECLECGLLVPENSESCPHCGFVFDERYQTYLETKKDLEILSHNMTLFIAPLILGIILIFVYGFVFAPHDTGQGFLLVGALTGIAGMIGLLVTSSKKDGLERQYNLIRNDYGIYLEKEKQRTAWEEAEARERKERILRKNSGIGESPRCPTCGSTNVSRIGSGERMMSVVGLGILSKKINKTMKCNNPKCGYMW